MTNRRVMKIKRLTNFFRKFQDTPMRQKLRIKKLLRTKIYPDPLMRWRFKSMKKPVVLRTERL